MPLAGIRCTLTAMLMPALQAEQHHQPGRREPAERILVAPRQHQAAQHHEAKTQTSARQTIMPNSSPVTAKMKSVWLSGRMRFTVPSPGPLPEPAALTRSSRWRVSTWKVSPDRVGSMKLSMRARDVRQQRVGREQRRARRRRRARPPRTGAARPGRTSAAQTRVISMVWPMSGCRMSGTMVSEQQQRSRGCCRARRCAARPRENAQAARIDEGRLDELRGWMAMPASDDPAPRALHLGAEDQRRHHERHGRRHRTERGAPHMARRQEEARDQDHEGRDQEHRPAG